MSHESGGVLPLIPMSWRGVSDENWSEKRMVVDGCDSAEIVSSEQHKVRAGMMRMMFFLK